MNDKISIFGVEIMRIPNKTRKVLEWHYSISNNHFFCDTLELAIINIIAARNNREDMTEAAALLLGVNPNYVGVLK